MAVRQSTKEGFTLIEILVVVSVVTLLSSFVILYSSMGRSQIALSVEAAKIAQLITRARSLSISTYTQSGSSCGYGVNINYSVGSYSLFKYGTPQNCAINYVNVSDASYSEEESYRLSSSLVFDGTHADSMQYVFFLPPDPITSIWTSAGKVTNGSDAAVYIKTKNGNSASKVMVGAGGQVSF